jgi:type I restriction enzyme M protein
MANMNMIIHDMEGDIQIGDTFRRPHFRVTNRLRTFDRVLANPMWNQKGFSEQDYDNDELSRFARGFPGSKADWGWMQHILASLKPAGRAAVVLDTGAVTRGSGGKNANKERDIRQSFVDEDLIEGVIYLPENLFYNTNAAGIVVMLNKQKPEQLARSVYLVNASDEFVKGDPKNYLSAEGIDKIVEAYTTFAEIDGFARLVPYDEIVATDYNLSPMRHVDTGKSQDFRDIADLVDELDSPEAEAAAIDDQVRGMLKELGL